MDNHRICEAYHEVREAVKNLGHSLPAKPKNTPQRRHHRRFEPWVGRLRYRLEDLATRQFSNDDVMRMYAPPESQ